jgi:hypothetical protein
LAQKSDLIPRFDARGKAYDGIIENAAAGAAECINGYVHSDMYSGVRSRARIKTDVQGCVRAFRLSVAQFGARSISYRHMTNQRIDVWLAATVNRDIGELTGAE